MPPADASTRKHTIGRSVWLTVPGTLAVLAIGYSAMPPLHGLEDPAARLVFTVRWLLIAFLPYAAVCLHILYQRFAEGAHNPLAHAESDTLQVHCRVMQNTLEQLAWFTLSILVLATWLSPAQARFIPVACIFFAFARLAYWWGYLRNGTLGRAPAVQMTFTLNVSLLVAAVAFSMRGMMA
jgi:uncharacterized membrane protein YecN with MAPEG domain